MAAARPEDIAAPPSVTKEVFTSLKLPLGGIGSLIVILWSLVIYLAWPLWIFLFTPYLWAVHTSVARGDQDLPLPWRIGGGPVQWSWRLLGFFSACLPVLICLTFVVPLPSGSGDRHSPDILAVALGGPALLALCGLLPLMLTVVLRTGNPLLAYDPRLLQDLLRRFRGPYLRLLASQVFIVAVAVATQALLHAALAWIGVGQMTGCVIDLNRLATMVPWILGPLWLMVNLSHFSRRLAHQRARPTVEMPSGADGSCRRPATPTEDPARNTRGI